MHSLKLKQSEKQLNKSLADLEYSISKAINTVDARGNVMFEVFKRKDLIETKGIDYCIQENIEKLMRIQNQFNDFKEDLDLFFEKNRKCTKCKE